MSLRLFTQNEVFILWVWLDLSLWSSYTLSNWYWFWFWFNFYVTQLHLSCFNVDSRYFYELWLWSSRQGCIWLCEWPTGESKEESVTTSLGVVISLVFLMWHRFLLYSRPSAFTMWDLSNSLLTTLPCVHRGDDWGLILARILSPTTRGCSGFAFLS